MKKTIALIISAGSILLGVYIIATYGTHRGGEGALTYLGMWGMPLALLAENIIYFTKSDWLNPWLYYFFYFLQYQLLALLVCKIPFKRHFLAKEPCSTRRPGMEDHKLLFANVWCFIVCLYLWLSLEFYFFIFRISHFFLCKH